MGVISSLYLKIIFLITLICWYTNWAAETKAETVEFKVLAAGGALKTCSSLSRSNCRDDFDIPKSSQTKASELFLVTDKALENIRTSQYWRFDKADKQRYLVFFLESLKAELPEAVSRRKFTNAFRDHIARLSDKKDQEIKGEDIYQSLSDFNWYMMMDYFQVPQFHNGIRKQEAVYLVQSKREATTDIFKTFVGMAAIVSINKGRDIPNVLVMTSSARDPFDAVDFYLQVMSQAGATTQWLPLDKSLRIAIDTDRCNDLENIRAKESGSVERDRVFPDLVDYQQKFCVEPERLKQLVANADGIFINGGDQSLTRAAFIPGEESDLLKLIRKRIQANQLVIGGTSAGAAVQSGGQINGYTIPMIASGDSYSALVNGAFAQSPPDEGCQKNNSCGSVPHNALTYQEKGGLGVITTGVIDTHFSERGRQVRLMKLAQVTSASLSVGVDETTAVQIGESEKEVAYQVIGQHGVWFFETEGSRDKVEGLGHFLLQGDELVFQKDTGKVAIRFAEGTKLKPSIERFKWKEGILPYDQFRRFTQKLINSDDTNGEVTTRTDKPRFDVKFQKSKEFKIGQTRTLPSGHTLTSFSNLRIWIE